MKLNYLVNQIVENLEILSYLFECLIVFSLFFFKKIIIKFLSIIWEKKESKEKQSLHLRMQNLEEEFLSKDLLRLPRVIEILLQLHDEHLDYLNNHFIGEKESIKKNEFSFQQKIINKVRKKELIHVAIIHRFNRTWWKRGVHIWREWNFHLNTFVNYYLFFF